MKRPLALAAALTAVALTLTGCGAAGSSGAPEAQNTATDSAAAAAVKLPTKPGKVTIGSADFPENEILAYVFADAMRAHGVTVTLHTGVGERPAYLSALKDGSIGAIPEYSGSILDYLDRSATETSSEDVYAALQKVAASNGFLVTDYAKAEDADTITVTKSTAAKYGLKSIADLRKVAPQLRLGAPAPFQTVTYGVQGLKKIYGVEFGQFVPLSASGSVTQTALRDGTVDAADIFSTDPAIAKEGFVVLDDPKSLFNAQNVVPLFRKDVLTKPMKDACDAVAAKLTTEDLRSMLAQAAQGQSPSDIASKWVAASGLK